MKPKLAFNDIYNRLSYIDDFSPEPQPHQNFRQCFEKFKSTHRPSQFQTLNPPSSSRKEVITGTFNLPSSLLNNEFVKEKYTGSYVQVSPSKIETRRDFRNISTDTKIQRKSVIDSYRKQVPSYITLSQETKRALGLLANKNDVFSNFLQKRQYPDVRLNKKIVPQTRGSHPMNPIEVESSLVDMPSRSTNILSKRQVGKEEDKKKGTSEKRVLFFQPVRKDLKKNYQQLAEEQRKNKLEMQKQLKQEYAKPFNPPQNISAFAYIVYEPDSTPKELNKQESPRKKFPHSHKIIVSQNSRCMVEVASLTKIMTCILALEICSTRGIDAKKEEVYIGKFQSNIGGTSAQISEGEFYTLHDLYFGLMLPSGNDASIAIAVWGGKVLLGRKEEKKKVYYERFISEMNKKAKAIGMEKTNYANSHGLVNFANKSCAFDLALLCEYAMRNTLFKSIVSSKFYKTEISYNKPVSPTLFLKKVSEGKKKQQEVNQSKQEKRECEENDEDKDMNSEEDVEEKIQHEKAYRMVEWENTHQLLHEKPAEYVGIKTGVTTIAGPCLASCVRSRGNRMFIIIVLGCEKLGMRFGDTEKLKKWAFNELGLKCARRKKSKEKSLRQEEER